MADDGSAQGIIQEETMATYYSEPSHESHSLIELF